jgi:hypothetical protein
MIYWVEVFEIKIKHKRKIRIRLILLHKILHDETPLYLLNEILLHANHQSSYNLRFNQVFEPPLCNTTSNKCSFFPNVIDSWNLLDVDTQNQHSRLKLAYLSFDVLSVVPIPVRCTILHVMFPFLIL